MAAYGSMLAQLSSGQKSPTVSHSAPPEAGRLSLLDMRRDRFAKVLAQIELHRICEGHGHPFRLIHKPSPYAHGRLHAEGRIRSDALRERHGVLHNAPLGRDAANQTCFQCLLGAEEPSCKRNLGGEGSRAAILEQAPKSCAPQSTWGFSDLKAGVSLRDDQITLEGDPQTQPHDGAVHGSDHRLPVDGANEQITRVGIGLLRTAEPPEFLRRSHLTFLNIRTAGECFACSAEYRHVCILILIEL